MSSTDVRKKGGFHYAFLIVAACLVMCTVCALNVNCTGVYLAPVTSYFGIPSATFMLYFTILQICMVIALPIAGKIINQIDLRIFFTVCAILCAIGNLMFAFAPGIWMFYIGAVITGIGTAPMLFLAVPKLIGAWCVKRVGFFTGLCLAFTGIGGVVFNPVQTAFINLGVEGWRTGYIFAAVVTLVLVLPFSIFVIRTSPADKGLLPYGAGEGVEDSKAPNAPAKGVSANRAMKLAGFYAIAVAGGLFALNQCVYQFFPKYCLTFQDSLPEIAALSGLVASATMAGLAIGKVALGFINDKSAKAGVTLSVLLGIIGILCIWLMPSVAPVLLIGAFLFGFVYAGTTVESTLLTRAVFGDKDYAQIYSRVSMVSSLGGAIAATAWGLVVDMPNGYTIMFVLSLVVMVLIYLLAMFALSQTKKYESLSE